MTSLTHELMSEYVSATSDGKELFQQEPLYRAQMDTGFALLIRVEEALKEEGLDEEAQRRVLTHALYGMPDKELAMQRLRNFRESVRQAMSLNGLI